MCHKKTVCVNYKRKLKGESDVCANCEYIAKVQKTTRFCQIALIISIIMFIVTTYLVY